MQRQYWGGEVWKKSQHIGSWKKRHVIITARQLLSFKRQAFEKQKTQPSFKIEISNIKGIMALNENLENRFPMLRIRYGIHESVFALELKSDYIKFIWALISSHLILLQIPENMKVIKQSTNKTPMINSYRDGYIYKKSQHFGEWHERYVMITREKLMSFRNQNFQQKIEPTFQIQTSDIRSVETTFETHDGYLIFIVRYGRVNWSTDFAVPYNYKDASSGWNMILIQMMRLD